MLKKITPDTSLDDALRPIREAVRHFYELRRTPKRSLPYDGYEAHREINACGDIPWNFTAEGLKHHKERDREPIDMLLVVAYQLGWSVAQTRADVEIAHLREQNESFRKEISDLIRLTYRRKRKKSKGS